MRKILLGLMALSLTTAMAGETVTLQQKQRASFNNDRFQSVLIPEGTVKKGMVNAPTRAEETKVIDYTLAEEPYSGLVPNNVTTGDQVIMLMYLSPEMTTAFDGATLKTINFWTGTNSNRVNAIPTYNIVVMEDISGDPIYEREYSVTKEAFANYNAPLEETIKLEAGKGLYVGCYVTLKTRVTDKNADYCVVVDAIPTSDTTSAYVGAKKANATKWTWLDPEELTAYYGSVCLGVTIEGDKYPVDAVNLLGVDAPIYAAPGDPFSIDVYVKSVCANAINSLEFEYKVGSSEAVAVTQQIKGFEGFNKSGYLTIEGLTSSDNAPDVPVDVKITKVNGVENKGIVESCVDNIVSFPKDQGFKFRGLIEEGTGTWCGWCPRGIVMMETAKEKYPDVFNCIAIHYNDRMSVASCDAVTAAYFSGFPSAMVNRYEIVDPSTKVLEYYNENVLKNPTWVGFENLKAEMISDSEVKIESTSKTIFECNNDKRYRIAYYLTEDGLGPYPQSNNYAGGANGVMGGWEKKGSSAMTVYEDVARLLVGGVNGFADSYPEKIVSGESYTHTTTASTDAVAGNEFFVTAFIIDNVSGDVLNSYQIKVSKAYNAVAGVENDGKIIVNGAQGCIVVDGDFAKASIYSLAGQKMAEINAPENVVLPAGIYVVNADGFVKKVVVK